MNINLEPSNESSLRLLAERSGVTTERYAADALAAHVKAYDNWFIEAVAKGLKDKADGRVLSTAQSQARDQARRTRLKN